MIKVNRNLLVCLLTVISVFSAVGQTYIWQQKADFGGGERYDPFWFTINGMAYVGTGIETVGPSQPVIYKTDFWEFDPDLNIWTQKADFPGSGRYGARGFAVDGIGYAGTGWTPTATSTFYKYEPGTNSWSPISSFLGSARYTGTSFELGGKGYLGLGYAPCKNDFWAYDPVSDSWSQIASYPGSPRQAASTFTIGSKAYVGLGACSGSLYDDFAEYDPFNNNWTPIANFPGGARDGAYSFSIGQFGFVGLGYDYASTGNPFSMFSDFWKYDQSTDSWSLLQPPFPGKSRFEGMYFSLNNKGYLGLGSDTVFYNHYLSDVWELSIDPTSVQNEPNGKGRGLIIFPNPASNTITMKVSDNQELLPHDRISYSDSKGRIIESNVLETNSNCIQKDVSHFPEGMIFIKVVRNNVTLFSSSFLNL